MNYVDANILICSISDSSEKGDKSRELLKTQRLITSTLSLDEVAHKLLHTSLSEALMAVSGFSSSPNLLLVSFLPEDVDSFQEFLKKGLSPRDAIHALTAAKMKCSIIYSEDPDFDKLPITRKTPW